MPSLRGRLLAGTALGTSLVLLAAGIALYVMMRASLRLEFDISAEYWNNLMVRKCRPAIRLISLLG